MFFFFQAEDGIRDKLVTGVQTCALPIYSANAAHGGNSLEASAHEFPAGAGVRPTGLHLPYRAVPLGPEWLDLSSPCRQLSDVAVARHDQQPPRRRNLPQVRGVKRPEIHGPRRRPP